MARHFDSERRGALKAFGLLAIGSGLGLAGVLAARPAAAVTALASRDYGAVLDQGCGANAYHRRMLDEAAAKLGVELTEEQRTAVLATVACPTCGCPLLPAVAAADGAF